jgi:hypothetical protein
VISVPTGLDLNGRNGKMAVVSRGMAQRELNNS